MIPLPSHYFCCIPLSQTPWQSSPCLLVFISPLWLAVHCDSHATQSPLSLITGDLLDTALLFISSSSVSSYSSLSTSSSGMFEISFFLKLPHHAVHIGFPMSLKVFIFALSFLGFSYVHLSMDIFCLGTTKMYILLTRYAHHRWAGVSVSHRLSRTQADSPGVRLTYVQNSQGKGKNMWQIIKQDLKLLPRRDSYHICACFIGQRQSYC